MRLSSPATVFAVAFAVLCALASPSVGLGDAGELTSAVFGLGVAHETGFSLYCLLGKLCTLIPVGEVAFRVAVLSALGAAAALAWLHAIVLRLGESFGVGRATATAAGFAAALLCLGNLTFFRAATGPEVYTPTLAAIALLLWLFERRQQFRAAGPLLALVGGLSLGLHGQLRILVGPALLVWGLWRLRRGDRWPLWAPFALGLGAAVVAYLPLRAWRGPAADWADPRTLTQLFQHLGASRIRASFADEIWPSSLAIWADHVRLWGSLLESQLGVPALVAAAGGLWALLRREKTRALGVVLLVVVGGDSVYSLGINPMGMAELQDGVPTVFVVSLLAASGVLAAALRFGRGAPFAATVLGCLCAGPAMFGDLDAKLHLDAAPSRPARRALDAAPARALLLTTTDDRSATIMYEMLVAGARPDLTWMVRQQLWDSTLVRTRTARAGAQIATPFRGKPWAAWSTAERVRAEPEFLRQLVQRELTTRTVLWEPGADSPPVPPTQVALGAWWEALTPNTAAATEPNLIIDELASLFGPGRDPLLRRTWAAALGTLARAASLRGDDGAAKQLFEAALVVRPSDGAAATSLGVLRARAHDVAGAIRLVQPVVVREPGRIPAWMNLGRWHLLVGDAVAAEAAFDAARKRAPRDPAPLVGLGRVALQRGALEDADRWLAQAKALGPDPEAHLLEEELRRRREVDTHRGPR